MAYEVNQGDQPQQVAGSSPLSQGGSAPAAQPQRGAQPSGQPSTPATIQTGASVNQAASQGAAQNKKSGSASSGMFTNVQKYVERNRPQAQKIAKAVTQDFSKQAGQIAQQVNKQKEDQQAKLTANQRLMEDQMKEAETIVGGVMGTGQQAQQPADIATAQQPADVPTPTPEEQQAKFQADVDRFRALSKGPVGIQQVGGLNLGQEAIRSQALANLAKGAGREGARKQLMREAFGDRQYTRGQASLDDLILGGSQKAKESLIQGARGEAQKVQDLVSGTMTGSNEALLAQQEAMKKFGGQVTGLARGAEETTEADLDKAYEDYMKGRTDLLGEDMSGIQTALEDRQKEILKYLGADIDYGKGYSDTETALRRYAELIKAQDTGLGTRGEGVFGSLAKGETTALHNPAFGRTYRGDLSIDDAEKGQLWTVNEDKLREANKELIERLGYGTEADLGARTADQVYSDIWRGSTSDGNKSYLQLFKAQSIADAFKNLAESQRNLNFEKQMKDAIYKKTGVNYEDLMAGSDISRYDVGGQENVDRFNKLQQLLGETGDVVTEEQLNQNVTTTDALASILDKYRIK